MGRPGRPRHLRVLCAGLHAFAVVLRTQHVLAQACTKNSKSRQRKLREAGAKVVLGDWGRQKQESQSAQPLGCTHRQMERARMSGDRGCPVTALQSPEASEPGEAASWAGPLQALLAGVRRSSARCSPSSVRAGLSRAGATPAAAGTKPSDWAKRCSHNLSPRSSTARTSNATTHRSSAPRRPPLAAHARVHTSR